MFFYFTTELVENKILRETKTTSWKTSSSEYLFGVNDKGPYVYFPKNSDVIVLQKHLKKIKNIYEEMKPENKKI